MKKVMDKTKLTANQIYATTSYKEGKIAKKSAKLTIEIIGKSVTTSEQFTNKSAEYSRTKRRMKSEQSELDAFIDQQKEDDSSDFVR